VFTDDLTFFIFKEKREERMMVMDDGGETVGT
jgi:hypothetical protein